MDFRVILILIAEALFAFLLLLRAGVLKSRRAVLVSVLLIAAAGELQYPVPLLPVSVLLFVDKRPLSDKAAEHLL